MPTQLRPHGPRFTVLLVDDDQMLCRLLARALAAAGFGVLVAADGLQALEVMRSSSSNVGLVVADITMPVMDGFEFAQAFRPLYPSIPILFMTGALPTFSNGLSLRDVGARLLLKPFSPGVFTDVVSTMLADGPSARRTFA